MLNSSEKWVNKKVKKYFIVSNNQKLLDQAQQKHALGTLNSFDFRQIQLNHTRNELNLEKPLKHDHRQRRWFYILK